MNPSHIFLSALMAVSSAFAASTSHAADHSGSQIILSCQESSGDSLVTESAKKLSIEQSAGGQLSLTVLQNESSSQQRILLNAEPVTEESCNGYQPCRLFVSDTIQFFINFYSRLDYQPGHLEANVNGLKISAHFHCTQK